MEGHQGISNKGSFTHLSSEGEQGHSSYSPESGECYGHCRKATRLHLRFFQDGPATVKPTVNRGWRPGKEEIFPLFLPSDQLMPPFCRT